MSTTFYFSNKGYTRKAGCENLWPVNDDVYTPDLSFFEEHEGLIVRINPVFKRVDEGFSAQISIYDPKQIVMNSGFIRKGCVLSAHVSATDHVYISMNIFKAEANDPQVYEICQQGVGLVYEAKNKFREFFHPRQVDPQ